jgi:hypothetical protein
LAAPGQSIGLDAATSYGTCVDGALQFRFAVDNGPELRGWSENPIFLAVPQGETDYLVSARCSTDTSCMGSSVVNVDVACPSSGALAGPFPETVLAASKTAFGWTTALDYDLFTGELSGVGGYAGMLSSGSGSAFPAAATPSPGQGFYYVVRRAGEFCNDTGLWTSGGAGESPLREGSLP